MRRGELRAAHHSFIHLVFPSFTHATTPWLESFDYNQINFDRDPRTAVLDLIVRVIK